MRGGKPIGYVTSAILFHISVLEKGVYLLDRFRADVMFTLCRSKERKCRNNIKVNLPDIWRTYSTFLWFRIGRHGTVL
jgi:hypothetical protein